MFNYKGWGRLEGWFKWLKNRLSTSLIPAVFGLLVFVSPASAFDFAGWDALLEKYVETKTISGVQLNAVAYNKLKDDPAFNDLVRDLKTYRVDRLKTQHEKLVFWINTYNIMAVKMVLDHYPVKSIKDAGSLFSSVWKKEVGTVGGKERTLNEIEHEILRKMDEPRIHLAIVCASVSCPDLRKEAYTVDKLDAQLEDQVRKFLENQGKGLKIEDGRVYLSSIFKWFEEDFESRGGVLKFIGPYLDPDDRKKLVSDKLKVSYLNYDWDLNQL